MDDVLSWLLVSVMLASVAAVFGAIFAKAGYSRWLGLVMLVPLLNLVWLIIFASREWPIQRELARRRVSGGGANPDDAATVVSEIARLEQRGEWEQAASAYERLATTPDYPGAEYAAHAAARARDRIARQAGL